MEPPPGSRPPHGDRRHRRGVGVAGLGRGPGRRVGRSIRALRAVHRLLRPGAAPDVGGRAPTVCGRHAPRRPTGGQLPADQAGRRAHAPPSGPRGVDRGVPRALPGLLRAQDGPRELPLTGHLRVAAGPGRRAGAGTRTVPAGRPTRPRRHHRHDRGRSAPGHHGRGVAGPGVRVPGHGIRAGRPGHQAEPARCMARARPQASVRRTADRCPRRAGPRHRHLPGALARPRRRPGTDLVHPWDHHHRTGVVLRYEETAVSFVLAALDNSASARAVLDAALRVGRLTGTPVRAVYVRTDPLEPFDAVESTATRAQVPLRVVEGPLEPTLIAALGDPEVIVAAIGAWSGVARTELSRSCWTDPSTTSTSWGGSSSAGTFPMRTVSSSGRAPSSNRLPRCPPTSAWT